MLSNNYAGVVSDELPELIEKRARRMHVTADQIRDLQQMLVVRFSNFRFDPSRCGDATPQVVLTNLIDRYIRQFVRDGHRYQQRLRRFAGLLDGKLPPRTAPKGSFNPTRQIDMQLDIGEAVRELSRRDQVICSALSAGRKPNQIGREMGMSRGSMACAIRRIRRAFRAAGLTAWMAAN